MSTYLKNMAGYKHNQLKNKSFDDVQKLFDKAMKRVNTFIDMDTKLVEDNEVRAEGSETRTEGNSKRAGEDLQQDSIKNQKVDEDNETTELQRLIEVVPDKEEVAIDAIPLATKPPSILESLKLLQRQLFRSLEDWEVSSGYAMVQKLKKAIVTMEYLVKISKKARILELKRRHLKKLTLTSYMSYPSRKIRRICACTSQETTKT
ncbi:hypothetical protein Tco_1080344 [Tanacetum coccineum]|uniref:Uncharacterized protein n=1 Tax=Tanacetum coccineum TaxID=301880 RepID=A0ABQ5HVP5_9ASTR